MLTQFRAFQETEPVLPKERGQINGRIKITINGAEHSLYRYTGKYSAFVSIDGKSEYACSPDTEALFDRYCVGENSNSDISVSKGTPEDRLVGLSVECAEPKTQDDYLAVARKIVAQWLDSLKTETGRYKLESHRLTDSLADNRVFHGDGYVNGGREFVCYVGFDTPTEDESTAFYASGTYDTFYHYYFGPGVFARFRWKNGVCTLIDYAVTVNVSEKEISGDFLVGDYRLKITAGGSEFVGKASVKEVPPEMLYYFPTFVTAEKTDGGINLLLKNDIWNKEDVLLKGGYGVQYKQDDIWLDTFYFRDYKETEIAYGEEKKIFLADQSDYLDEMREAYKKIVGGEYDSILEESVISEVKSMTFEEYLRDKANIGVPQKGDLCRAELLLGNGETEYVYFRLP